jgi:hypothetical protein
MGDWILSTKFYHCFSNLAGRGGDIGDCTFFSPPSLARFISVNILFFQL